MAPHRQVNLSFPVASDGSLKGRAIGPEPPKRPASAEVSMAPTWWVLRKEGQPTATSSPLVSLVWYAWVVALVAGSALLLDTNVFVYAGFVAGAFLMVALIPDSGDSPAPFFYHLAVPFFAIKGWQEGGAWTPMAFYWAFVLLPLCDLVVGVDTFNKHEEEYKQLRERKAFRVATWIFVPTQLAFLAYACFVVNTIHLSALELTGVIVSVGVYTGGLGVTVSHELSHKTNRVEQWLGRVSCMIISYGHFFVEHNRGHHKLVATDDDPATARFGESFYSFLPRCVVGSLVSAWRLEQDRCRDRNLPWWQNEMLWYWTASGSLCAALTLAFGPMAIPLFLGQSFCGLILFESVNYLEHYGLERRRNKDGKWEPVGYEHSWDAPHRLTNMVLFKLQRHGDHHVNCTRRFQMLRAQPERSPQLPMGYPGCIILALMPPLWNAVMNPRILQRRNQCQGRVWRHGPGA